MEIDHQEEEHQPVEDLRHQTSIERQSREEAYKPTFHEGSPDNFNFDESSTERDTNCTEIQENTFTDAESRLHEVEALLGTLLSIPSQNSRHILKVLGEDPFMRRVLARVEKSTFGPSVSNVLSPSAPNKSVYDHDSNVNPFKVGPTKLWQQDLLTKIIAKQDPNDIDLQASSSTLFPDSASEDDSEDEIPHQLDLAKE